MLTAVETYNLLANIKPEQVIRDPFPHLIVRNPLSSELARRLTTEFPPDAVMTGAKPGSSVGSNKRFNIYARDVRESNCISPAWKKFIEEQSSIQYVSHAFRLFSPYLREYYPELVNRFGEGGEHIRAGVRLQDKHPACDVLLDAGISINTPVTTIPTSVRTAHLDLPTKLFTGLYYLRPPEDRDSEGGELVLLRWRPGVRRRCWKYNVDPGCVEDVKTIPYENNVLVLFLNSLDSLHAVTPRLRTTHTRKFVNLVVGVEQPLFDSSPFQVPRLSYQVKYYARQFFSWMHASKWI